MNKKILSLLLICTLISLTILLTGCGEKQNQEQKQNVEEQTQETSVAEIYKQYIIEKKYEKEIADWSSKVDEYSILDIDQDGTEELILKAKDLDFFYALICGYNKDSQEVIVIDNIYGYGGLKYNSDTKEIGYSEMRQIQEAMGFGFYKIEDKKLVLTRAVGYEYQQYFIAEGENRRNATSDEVYAEIDKAKAIEYQKISDLINNQEEIKNTTGQSNSTTEENKMIKAGNYTLQYGKYKDKYGTIYTLNQDGTYTCESKQTGKQYSKSGTYIIYNCENYEKEIEEYEEKNGPIGFSGKWMIAFNYDNNDSSKPYLMYSYNIEDNNKFYNGQTDEIWEHQEN